jgi:hypothetical protein
MPTHVLYRLEWRFLTVQSLGHLLKLRCADAIVELSCLHSTRVPYDAGGVYTRWLHLSESLRDPWGTRLHQLQ